MNMLKGVLSIYNKENIGGVVEASLVDLKSEKHIRELVFAWWNSDNYDAETEAKIVEVLKPHDALQSLYFFNYTGNRLPIWIMSGLRNLMGLVMEGSKMVNRMVGMEFASLIELRIKRCPMLSDVLMATPKLRKLEVSYCRVTSSFFALLAYVVSDGSELHLIIAQLEDLKCPCHVFEHFIQQLEAANSWCTKLKKLEAMAGGVGVASLPRAWPSILKSLETLEIGDILRANFQFLPNDDGIANFPPWELKLVNWYRMARLPSDLCKLTSLRSLQIDNFPGLVSFEMQCENRSRGSLQYY